MNDLELIARVKESHKFNSNWYYDGWDKIISPSPSQKDWNNSILSTIMFISSRIHRVSLRRGATDIIVNRKLEPMISGLDFYKEEFNTLGSINVIYTDDVEIESLYLVDRIALVDEFMSKATYGETIVNEAGEEETEMSDISIVLVKDYSDKVVKEYRDCLIGKINILNYEK